MPRSLLLNVKGDLLIVGTNSRKILIISTETGVERDSIDVHSGQVLALRSMMLDSRDGQLKVVDGYDKFQLEYGLSFLGGRKRQSNYIELLLTASGNELLIWKIN